MSIIPHFVLTALISYLDPLLHWFSERVYADLLGKAADHLLVQLHHHLDLAPLEAACAAFHHSQGPGARPTHPVPQLVRALLLKYLYDWSLRELESQIRFNMLVKWFVGYPIFAFGPDHATLDRFEIWVDYHQHRAFFDQTLHQIDQAFPQERLQDQIGDTFALQANAARESLIRLLRHTCQRLLAALQRADPSRADQVRAQLDTGALFGPAHEVGEYRLSPGERAARLHTTVCAALDCAHLVCLALEQPTPLCTATRAPVEQWLDLLDKIIHDDVQLVMQGTHVVQASERPAEDKGSYRVGSATDPQATYRVHDDQTDLGYNVSLAVSDNFVREIRADTGAQPDAVAIPDLIRAQREHHQLTPGKLIYDAAAGTGKTHARVRQASEGHTQLVAPLIPYEKRSGLFTPDRFQLSDDGQTLTCPHGQSSSTAYSSSDREGRDFRFFAAQCRGCPLWADCRQHKPGSQAHRTVFISDYRHDVEAARAYSQTPQFQADRQRRPRVERFIAALVRYNGARRARRRGLRAADFQAKMAAMAYNLKRWMRLLETSTQPAQG